METGNYVITVTSRQFAAIKSIGRLLWSTSLKLREIDDLQERLDDAHFVQDVGDDTTRD